MISTESLLIDEEEGLIAYKVPDPYYSVEDPDHPREYNYRLSYTRDTPAPGRTFEYPAEVEAALEAGFTTWYSENILKGRVQNG